MQTAMVTDHVELVSATLFFHDRQWFETEVHSCL